MRVYAVAENCYIQDETGALDGGVNEPEPVVLTALGVWEDAEKAEKKCKKLNKEWDRVQSRDGHEEEHYEVVSMEVK